MRDLAEDERWFPASERNTLTANYRRYNFLREALASSDKKVAASARGLRSFLRREWAAFTDGFPEAVSMMDDAVERQAWERRLKPVYDLRQVSKPAHQPSPMRAATLVLCVTSRITNSHSRHRHALLVSVRPDFSWGSCAVLDE